jgi:hypothetical protein
VKEARHKNHTLLSSHFYEIFRINKFIERKSKLVVLHKLAGERNGE